MSFASKTELLDITDLPYSDTSVEDYQFHSYQPYTSGEINYNDEVRIAIQDLEANTAPCNSYLYIEGKLTKEDGTETAKLEFINNAIAYLFREIRYELNGTIIDSVRDVGHTSTLKGYLSYNENESTLLQNAGWFPKKVKIEATPATGQPSKIIKDDKGNFNTIIPLKHLMGFFEDFRKLIVHMRQELVLIRASSDLDAITSLDETEKPKITISKIFWVVPHLTLSLSEQLRINKITNKSIDLPIHFRSWEILEMPSLTASNRHTWPVKTSSKVETARHIIVGFQKNKKNKILSDMSKFDNIKLRNIRVFLNSEKYPYSDLLLDFDNNKYATLYEMYANFQESYYYNKLNQPIFNPKEFKDYAPIAHIDCSRQKEAIQTGSVVMRIEFETDTATTSDITAYCLILHEKRFTYNPLTKIVHQL